jgi:hypothetical protein
MYKIRRGPDGVSLQCHDCSHVERIDAFNESLGSRRTQAARAMQNHSRQEHGAGSVLNSMPDTNEVDLERGIGIVAEKK